MSQTAETHIHIGILQSDGEGLLVEVHVVDGFPEKLLAESRRESKNQDIATQYEFFPFLLLQ